MRLTDITTNKTLFDIHSPTLVEDLTRAIPEIGTFISDAPVLTICQYLILMYDINSPMHREVRMFYERKYRCAEIVGFPEVKGKWAPAIEDMLTGTNESFNWLVASYVSQMGLPEYTQLVAYIEIQKIKTIEVFSGRISDKSDQILDRVTISIGEITKKLFGSGQEDEITLAKKALYQRATIDKSRLIPMPEKIVRILEEDGELPEDFNPYGEDYKVEKSHFIGDVDPQL